MVNCHSVALATKVQNFFTVAKLLAIAVIVAGGLVMFCRGLCHQLIVNLFSRQ